jgi:3',5'-cyclic AMP phosphodiesterase CpdA
MKGGNEPLRFMHATDLHLARRNDEILADVLQHKEGRFSEEIRKSYVNFNEHFRQFIQHANGLAEKGELDFVVMTGDLVDFANPGWVDKPCFAQSNWKTFVNILIGAENRPQSKGLKVAVFTSLGNHDWRLHPYNPCLKDGKMFGLEKDEIKDCVYKGFDSASLRPDDPRRREAERMSTEIYRYMNVKGIQDKIKLFLAPYLANTVFGRFLWAFLPAGLAGGLATWSSTKVLSVIIGLVAVLLWLWLRWLTRKAVDLLVDNPLHAGPSAVHFYLKYVNPYFDYAFRCGPHWFIVMDTGADVFTGRLLDGKNRSEFRKMSREDNIFGGSPDSRAFETDHTYCDWSQIVWLERVLSAAGKQNPDGRKLVFAHAPPINTEKSNKYVADNLAESKRSDPKWVPEEECNLTYGTINHYLSQFFHLCLGRREGDPNFSNPQDKVDLVLSGHAHRNIEFRIGLGGQDKIRIYTDDYSRWLNKALGNAPGVGQATQWWESYRPVIVQTGSCGPKGDEDLEPPYFRRVTINSAGEIQEFLPDHL